MRVNTYLLKTQKLNFMQIAITYVIAYNDTHLPKFKFASIDYMNNFKAQILHFHFNYLITRDEKLFLYIYNSSLHNLQKEHNYYSYKSFLLSDNKNLISLYSRFNQEEKWLKYIKIYTLFTFIIQTFPDCYINITEIVTNMTNQHSLPAISIETSDLFEKRNRYEVNLYKKIISSILSRLESKLKINYPIIPIQNFYLSREQKSLFFKFLPYQNYQEGKLNFKQFLYLIANTDLFDLIVGNHYNPKVEKFKFIMEDFFLLLRFLNILTIFLENIPINDLNHPIFQIKQTLLDIFKKEDLFTYEIPFDWKFGDPLSNTMKDNLYLLLENSYVEIYKELILTVLLYARKPINQYLCENLI